MSELTHPIDRVVAGDAAATASRPLIHDIMPPNDQLGARTPTTSLPATERSAPMTTDVKVAEAKLSGQYLDVPPLSAAESRGIVPVAPVKPGHEKAEKADPFKTGGDQLELAAEANVGRNLTQAPKGMKIGHIDEKFGCAATVSNLLIKTHQMSKSDFVYNVDDLERKATGPLHATKVDAAHLQNGDIVFGRDQLDGSGGRHVGVAQVGADGKVYVYNNSGGHLKRDPLDSRFLAKFGTVYGYHRDAGYSS